MDGVSPWLRWLPVPFAAAASLVGWVVLGDTLGQHAGAHVHSYEAGGLSLSVGQMVWMSNDMSGQGPLAPKSQGFQMDPSMMPGMQTVNDDRLRLQVTLRNGTADALQYSASDFHVVAPNGQRWSTSDDGGSVAQKAAVLGSGYSATVDLYFDVPVTQTKNLSIEWSRGGSTVEIPVDTSGRPQPHSH
jgi:hypothetical protein